MNQAIDAGNVPPPPGLEKEEPEIGQEEDIPTEDRGVARGTERQDPAADRPRDVERE